MIGRAISNVPHVPRTRAVLDARATVRNPITVFEKYRARCGQTFSFHFGGVKPAVATTDPVVLEHVLRGNRDNYHKSDIQVERMVEFQGKGLVNSHGEMWLRQRRLLAQGFKPNHLARLLPMQQDVLRELLEGFDRAAQRGPVDVHHQMVRFTLRLVGRSLLGRSMSDGELDRIAHAISEIQTFVLQQIIQPYKIPWFRISGETERLQRLRREGDGIVLRYVEERLRQGLVENEFLKVLLETPYHDTGQPMEQPQAMIELLQLIVAGNETSSIALTWTLYLLARHPRYIGEIRDEVASVIGGDPIDYRNLHRLDGTMRVINEALRLYPPFWMIDRVALADDEVAGVHIPAGAMVIPYIYGTHRNPAHWQDVETFDPGRFETHRAGERHPFAYIPFGGGPRICIGNNMAITQILLIVVALARRYDFRMAQDGPAAIRPMMLLRPQGAVPMHFRPVA